MSFASSGLHIAANSKAIRSPPTTQRMSGSGGLRFSIVSGSTGSPESFANSRKTRLSWFCLSASDDPRRLAIVQPFILCPKLQGPLKVRRFQTPRMPSHKVQLLQCVTAIDHSERPSEGPLQEMSDQ